MANWTHLLWTALQIVVTCHELQQPTTRGELWKDNWYLVYSQRQQDTQGILYSMSGKYSTPFKWKKKEYNENILILLYNLKWKIIFSEVPILKGYLLLIQSFIYPCTPGKEFIYLCRKCLLNSYYVSNLLWLYQRWGNARVKSLS